LTRINSAAGTPFHHARDVFASLGPPTVNITGIVVYAKPDRCGAVRSALAALGGVEVHAVSPEGRMVVTVEQPDDRAATETLDAVARVEGVLSTALVYHHDEPLNEESTNR
jgi:nitrate reductase NapD